MTWPLWFVIGLVVIAALITIAYVMWLQAVAEYAEVRIPDDTISSISGVYLCDDDEDPAGEELVGYLVMYRDANLQAPWQLSDTLERKLTPLVGPDSGIESVTVTKEPGYNSFRVYHKNKDLLVYASEAWTHSVFHAMVMPLELLLRWSLFPIWTMIDFVSHERRVVAALVMLPKLKARPATVALIKDNVNVVETYNSLFIHTTDCGMVRFGPSRPIHDAQVEIQKEE